MVYSNLIFILALFPLTAIISLFDRSAEYKNLILIIASLLFFSWGRPLAVCLIFLTVFADWGAGLAVYRFSEKRSLSTLFLALDGLMNLAVFLVFGHNYLFNKISALSFDEAILPIGIGFYTIRGFYYVFDIYKRGFKPERNPLCLFTYMVSFHLMAAGPVMHYCEVEPQIREREITTEKLNMGFNKIVWGFGKIVLIAPVFERIKLAGLNGSEITTIGCWLGMLAFFAQYYFTFTGLCDMGKGMGLVGGFCYSDNYTDIDANGLFSGLVKSFNTTVIGFFTDVAGIKRDSSKIYTAVAAVICGIAVSFWYDAKLNYLIAGLAAGLLIALEKLVLEKPLSKLPVLVKYIYLVITSMIIFGALYFDSLYGYRKWLLALVGVNTKYALSVSVKYAVLKNLTLIVIAFFIICPQAKKLVLGIMDKIGAKSQRSYGAVRIIKTICTAFVFLLSVITLTVEYTGV
ncbi:acyltransferase [uncultured Ruminococcus sp.]|uniref:acyltransferase n=1 Tax=uncultured Ruminococcus sp. TaxID=165186 RepID=UPI0025D21F2E|nr:acyltransferase [uncultured Ruminococcus sp.]